MKRPVSLAFCILTFFTSTAQNTGIGTNTPVQTLDVNGAIKVGNSSNNQAGSIRYNSGNFEGGNGTNWNLLGLPSKAIILSQSADTASLKTAGFSVLRQMDNWDTAFIPVSTNYPGLWTVGFPLSSSVVTPAYPASAESVFYNNNLYEIGNDGYVYDYDVAAQKWLQLPNICPLGTRQAGCGFTRVGNELFLTGGWKYVVGPGFVIYNTCAKYNLSTNTWTTIANIPVNNCYHATAAIGTDIYILDGASTFSTNFDYAKKMYRYNTVTNTWSANLAVAATPDFLVTGQLVSWNSKLLYHTGGLYAVAYDPVAHTNTYVSGSAPPGIVYSGYLIALNAASNKLDVLGYIPDTTNIDPVPNTYMFLHYELDLAGGSAVKENVCKIQSVSSMNSIQFNPVNNLLYVIGGTSGFVFDRTGSEQCDLILRRKGYWFYMKKN